LQIRTNNPIGRSIIAPEIYKFRQIEGRKSRNNRKIKNILKKMQKNFAKNQIIEKYLQFIEVALIKP
jgi:hypothetical protein